MGFISPFKTINPWRTGIMLFPESQTFTGPPTVQRRHCISFCCLAQSIGEWNPHTSLFLLLLCFRHFSFPQDICPWRARRKSSLMCYQALRCYFCRIAYNLRSCCKAGHFKAIVVSRSRSRKTDLSTEFATPPFLRAPISCIRNTRMFSVISLLQSEGRNT